MYGNCTYRVIHVKLIVAEPHSKYHQYTCYSSDSCCAQGICHITGSCNGYKSCQGSIETHGHIRLSILHPCKYHTYTGCNSWCDCGCKEDGTKLLHRDTGCTVEAIPTQPKDEYTKAGDRQVVSRECIHLDYLTLLILDELSNPWSQHGSTDEGTDSTYHMDTVGTCKIMEANGT